jgi:hypothetical protein
LFHAGRLRLFIKRGSPPIYCDQLDYEVIEDARAIGRIYEDLHVLPELRWFWSITVFVGYRPGRRDEWPNADP